MLLSGLCAPCPDRSLTRMRGGVLKADGGWACFADERLGSRRAGVLPRRRLSRSIAWRCPGGRRCLVGVRAVRPFH